MAQNNEQFITNSDVLSAAADVLSAGDQLAQLAIDIQQIPAPTDDERQRAAWVATRFESMGLDAIKIDDLHTVFACRRGANRDAPALLLSAHTDTVFPAETDLSVRKDAEKHRIYGPGIGDNSAGVASLLSLAEMLSKLPMPAVDIWFVANSGEEGLGDLRGMRAAVERLHGEIGASIVIEGMGLGRIVHRGLGSRRYRITARAPGGHSWSDFGTASAIHALVLLAAEIAQIKVPPKPRTTYNIGRISGGTSINTIAQEASFELDLRSEERDMLDRLIQDVHAVVQRFQGVRWQRWGVEIEMETIGDRPSGAIASDHPLVEAAAQALVLAGLTAPTDLRISSTDANIPLSLGIPAVCVGVTHGGNAHRLEEWIDPRPLPHGVQHLLLLTWWASEWLATG